MDQSPAGVGGRGGRDGCAAACADGRRPLRILSPNREGRGQGVRQGRVGRIRETGPSALRGCGHGEAGPAAGTRARVSSPALRRGVAHDLPRAEKRRGLRRPHQIGAPFEAAATAKPGQPPGHEREYLRRHCGEVLRTIYLAQKNVAAYVALTTETGLTAEDCHAVATLLVTRRMPDEALAWVERGLALDREHPHGYTMAGHHLTGIHRELLTRLGRGNEAIETAWVGKVPEERKVVNISIQHITP